MQLLLVLLVWNEQNVSNIGSIITDFATVKPNPGSPANGSSGLETTGRALRSPFYFFFLFLAAGDLNRSWLLHRSPLHWLGFEPNSPVPETEAILLLLWLEIRTLSYHLHFFDLSQTGPGFFSLYLLLTVNRGPRATGI